MTSTAATLTTREEWRKEQAKLEAQRAGNMPPDTDEDGNAINPHIPQYMSEAPWYLKYDHKTLQHQKKIPSKAEQEATSSIGDWYQRGKTAGPAATKFRKGACQNCGAMTHKAKDCVERPRKVGAKYTGKEICPDEIVADVKLSWAGKRDRWNGVDLEQQQREVKERHDIVGRERRRIKVEALREKIMALAGVTEQDLTKAEEVLAPYDVSRDNVVDKQMAVLEKSESPEVKRALKHLLSIVPVSEGGLADDEKLAHLFSDEDRQKDDINADASATDVLTNKVDTGGVRDGVEAKLTSRNLRIREDTAKYLHTLSTDPQFHYDPKTRSMRGNPYPDKGPDEVDYAGDNWVRESGEATKVDQVQAFCWDATRRLHSSGQDTKYINMQAVPTQAQRAYETAQDTKAKLKEKKSTGLISRYGGEEHLKTLPDELRHVTETYAEYRLDGTLVKGSEVAAARSKYQEDTYRNGHTSVWGSYWSAGSWGYKCCQSLVYNSVCVKTGGKDQQVAMLPPVPQEEAETRQDDKEKQREREREEAEMKALEAELAANAARSERKEAKEAKNVEEERKAKKEKKEKKEKASATKRKREDVEADNLKRISDGVQPSAAEMEEYRRNRVMFEDPMMHFSADDEEEG